MNLFRVLLAISAWLGRYHDPDSMACKVCGGELIIYSVFARGGVVSSRFRWCKNCRAWSATVRSHL